MPKKRGDAIDEIGTYKLSDEPPPKRRFRKLPGERASSERDPDEFDQPVLKRFLGTDPFPWALALCVLVWIGLGLLGRVNPLFTGLLYPAGLAVIFLSQIWLYVSIFMDDKEAGIWSFCFGLYRVFYLYTNVDLVWRPLLLSAIGLLMIFTGFGMFLSRTFSAVPN